jgi:hypothetical protein
VNRQARRWAAAAALILLLAGAALAFGQVTGTFAIFSAETENQNAVFNGSWIPAPSAATSSLNGTPWATEHLAWTSGNSAASPSPNPVTGQTIYYADGGAGASASCGSYSSFSTTTAAATTADVTGTNLSHWWCFEVFSTSTAATTSGTWTSDVATFTPRQILVPLTVTMVDNGGSTRMQTGDQVKIVFNQAVNVPTANRFCAVNNGAADVIFIGDTRTTGTCAATDTYTIGKITGVTISASTTSLTESVTRSTTTLTNDTLTIQLTAGTTSTETTGTAIFTGASGVTAVTGSQTQCISTASPNCTVSAGGHF